MAAIVDQQFEYAARISAAGLVPILEPEVSIGSPRKEAAETLLRDALQAHVEALPGDAAIMLKLTIPTQPGRYADLAADPRVAPGASPVRRLQPRRGVRAAGQGPEHDREFLPGAARGPVRTADRRAVQRATEASLGQYFRRLRAQGADGRLSGCGWAVSIMASRVGFLIGRLFQATGA